MSDLEVFTGGLRELFRGNSASPIRVALDIDGTIAKTSALMLENFNRAKGTNFTVVDYTDYGFKNIGSSYEEMMPFYVEVWKGQYSQIPFAGNADQIMELTKHYTVHILTSRSPNNDGLTGGTVSAMLDWLRMKGLGDLHVEICPPHMDKATHFDYHIYIDDSPELAKAIASAEGKFMLLIDQPYNKDIRDGSGVLRVDSSEAAVSMLLELARKLQPRQKTKRRMI